MSSQNYRVLLVDDEPDLREIYEMKFKMAGFDVLTASSGFEGLNLLRKEAIDAVISDINMKEGTGIDLLKQLRADGGNQIVIFVTGYADVSLFELFGYGIEAIFSKPADLDGVIKCLNIARQHRQDNMNRRYIRYQTTLNATLIQESGKSKVSRILNISQGGMLLQAPPPLPKMNQIVEFNISHLTDGLGVSQCKGLCKWVKDPEPNEELGVVGLEFHTENDRRKGEQLIRILNAVKTENL